MKKITISVLGALLILCNSAVLVAAQRYTSWTSFATQDGLTADEVRAIWQARDGALWFGTNGGGVSRFDGHWQNFTIEDGLISNNITAVYQDREGDIWLGTVEGVNLFDGTKWQSFDTRDGLAHEHIHCIMQDRAGVLWFGTAAGLSVYDGKSWRTWSIDDGLAGELIATGVTAMYQDRDEAYWWGTEAGLVYYDGERMQTFTDERDIPHNEITSIFQAADDTIWVGTRGGVSQYENETWRIFDGKGEFSQHDIRYIYQDSRGAIWFGSWGHGVIRYDGQQWQRFNIADGLADNYVSAIWEDEDGLLWFGTGRGVSRYDAQTWQTFAVINDLEIRNVRSAYQDRDGVYWFGTDTGLIRYDGTEWTTFNSNKLIVNGVTAIMQDNDGAMWFGTAARRQGVLWVGGGVSRYHEKNWYSLTDQNGLSHGSVWAITQDQEENIWISTDEGICYYDGQDCQTVEPKDGAPSSGITSIMEDRVGNLWFGAARNWAGDKWTDGGVARYDGSEWRYFTTADGLADNGVWAMLQSADDAYWFATDKGVSHFDGANWNVYLEEDGLAANTVTSILQDKYGHFWFGTAQGVTRYDGSTWRTYTTDDGLAANGIASILQDDNGSIWFGTEDGITRYTPTGAAPWVRIQEVNGNPYPGGEIRLPYGQSTIIVKFVGGDLKTDFHELNYQHRLEGAAERWTSPINTAETFAQYPNLEPGTYEFFVTARDTDFNYSAPASLVVTIESPDLEVATAPASLVIVPFIGAVETDVLYGVAFIGIVAVLGVGYSARMVGKSMTARRARERRFNPYIVGEPIRTEEMFFGREKMLRRITRTLHNNSIMIHGERRIGKTTLLYQLANRLRKGDPQYHFVPVLVDLEGTSEDEFFSVLIEDIIENCRDVWHTAPSLIFDPAIKGTYDARDFGRDLRAIIEHLQAQFQAEQDKRELRLILLMDEVDVMNNYDQATQQKLRRIFMKTFAHHLGAVVAGIHIDKNWRREESPWYNLFTEIKLGPLNSEEAAQLIRRPVEGVYSFDDDAVQLILEKSELHPQRVQQLSWEVINHIIEQGRKRVNRADVERVWRSQLINYIDRART